MDVIPGENAYINAVLDYKHDWISTYIPILFVVALFFLLLEHCEL